MNTLKQSDIVIARKLNALASQFTRLLENVCGKMLSLLDHGTQAASLCSIAAPSSTRS